MRAWYLQYTLSLKISMKIKEDITMMLSRIKEESERKVMEKKNLFDKYCDTPNIASIQNMIELKESQAELDVVNYIIDKIDVKINK